MIWLIITILSLICGLASAWGGAKKTNKNWRRLLVPAISAGFGMIYYWNPWMILLMPRAGAISLGYGIPDPVTNDEGSSIAQFWGKFFDETASDWSMWFVGLFTRGTIGLAKGISVIAIPIITGCWLRWIIVSLILIFNNILWGWLVPREGAFKFKKKRLLWEEFLIEAIDSFIIMGVIVLCK